MKFRKSFINIFMAQIKHETASIIIVNFNNAKYLKKI